MTAPVSATRSYHDNLRTLSEASVRQHFDAFLDIDWDHPDHAISLDDDRWILPAEDVLGAGRDGIAGTADLVPYEQAFEAIDRDPAHVLLAAEDPGSGVVARCRCRSCPGWPAAAAGAHRSRRCASRPRSAARASAP